jgi:hypothetical protein
MSVANSKVFLSARLERKDQDMKADIAGASVRWRVVSDRA